MRENTDTFHAVNWMNINEIFQKNVTYDNIKSHKNQGFTLSSENTTLE